ncbi:MAG TPA: MerR family transcriptional regulator [Thermoanaerobaculia bacterium]|nr:MerR family transcriptional regulator [Thermoanaerobaculia bacterium]
MRPPPWKVGELAKRTGVSVRTLHHYDEIGLLSPSHRSESGYRLYTQADVVRLQQVRSLRTLGFSLEEIGAFLKRPGVTPDRVLQLHIAHLKERIEMQQRLCDRMEAIARRWRADETVSTEEFLQVIEVTTMLDKYYTPEQMEELKQRREALGEDRIRQAEGEWKELMEQVQAEMDRGTDPADERVQQLARRWMGLVQEFTGGNPGIARSVGRMYQEETTVAGLDTAHMRQMMEYVGKAMAAKKPD